MEARKWEELPGDCLVNVLGRVGLESLLIDVPFVCKSWYKATLSPYCWQELDFPHIMGYSCLDDPFTRRFEVQYGLQGKICTTKFVKGVVDRSAGCATMVTLLSCYTEEALTYVADKCLALKKLVLQPSGSSTMLALLSLIGKFRNLELLEIRRYLRFKDTVTEIGTHCENFVSLSLVARTHEAYIGEKEVMTIVASLPKIRCLTLQKVLIKRENLIKILKGCMELVFLDVSGCRGFDEDDEELSKLASHIPTFKCSGSVFDTLDDSDDYDSDGYDSDGYDSYGYDGEDYNCGHSGNYYDQFDCYGSD